MLEDSVIRLIDKIVSSGLRDLDVMLGGGFFPGQATLLAARHSQYKTLLLRNIAVRAANVGKKVYFISEESSLDGEIYNLALVQAAQFSADKARDPEVLHQAYTRIDRIPITLDCDGFKPNSAALKLYKEEIDLLIYDGLSLMGITSDESADAQIQKAVRALKKQAVSKNCAVIVTIGLGRGPEMRSNKRPFLWDLEAGQQLESLVDNVLFTFRPAYYDHESPSELAEIIIAKHRNGPTGNVRVCCDRGLFSDYDLTGDLDA